MRIKLVVSLVLSAGLFACTGSDFSGTAGKAGTKSNRAEKSDGNDDGDLETDNDLDSKSGGSGGTDNADNGDDLDIGGSDDSKDDQKIQLDEETKKLRRQECWFAVSGTWIGHPSYESKYANRFPGTTSGNPIAHGEGFDNVGGVFLAARAEPYVYDQGGKEIDKAVDFTFDSIMIAPGMIAELKDASGAVVFKGEGPVISGSSTYENDPEWKGKYYAALKTRKDLPAWIKDYLSTHTEVVNINLHVARSVQVSAKSGSKCDFE